MWGLKSFVLPIWVKPAAVLAVLAIAWFTGWHMRGTHEKAKQAKGVERMLEQIQDANLRAVQADLKLQALLSQPKAGPVIREVVRANPNNCRVAGPVADGLRDAIRNANAATR